jgi:hypothetical protein
MSELKETFEAHRKAAREWRAKIEPERMQYDKEDLIREVG